MTDLNRVVLTGRLTRDPELKAMGDGTAILSIRLAFSTRSKDKQTGQWGDQSNYVDVTLFGTRAESLSRFLEKGRLIGVEGRLRWSEWDDKNTGEKRSKIDVIADNIEPLGARGESGGSGGGGERSYSAPSAPAPSAPSADPVFEDDIPF
jgi:single-strand DNA-binding protein